MNPFDELKKEILTGVEKLLKEHKQPGETKSGVDLLKYIPVKDLYQRKICSKTTLYAHVRAGDVKVYKFGNKTFVDKEEFEKTFKPVMRKVA